MQRPGAWDVKLRLGQAAPKEWTLHSLGVFNFDPAFGGRWNAGSNSRADGTTVPPDEYAAVLLAKMAQYQ